MIKKLLPLLLLILIGCSKTPVNGKLLEYSSKGYYHRNTGEIFSGYVFNFGINNDEEGYIKNGKRHGTFKSYHTGQYQDGRLKKESTYKNGKLHGTRKEYIGHGKELRTWNESEYKDGKRHGVSTLYTRDDDREIVVSGTYINGEPFDGTFEQTTFDGFSEFKHYIETYRDGEKISSIKY